MNKPLRCVAILFLAGAALLLAACSRFGIALYATATVEAGAAPADTAIPTAAPSAYPAGTAIPTPAAAPTLPATPTLTPTITPTPAPTLCARARISGQTCAAGQEVTISSCCPVWESRTTSGAGGRFEFAALTAGTFTVSSGGYSREVTLAECDSAAELGNLCPPTPLPTPTCGPDERTVLRIAAVQITDYRVDIAGEIGPRCAAPWISWDWGEGQVENGALPAGHTYANAGVYRVALTLHDNRGSTQSWSLHVLVGPYVGEMVWVEGGSFRMGCDPAVETCLADETPLHSVWLDGYFIDKYEVTNGQYQRCVNERRCTMPAPWGSAMRSYYYGNRAFAEFPVINVTWQQAATYCSWLGKRLPTEAEWEKAARGPADTRRYPWGNDEATCNWANIVEPGGYCVGDTAKVGSSPAGASPYGAMDMAGNVWEWTADWYAEDYYGVSPSANPTGPASGQGKVLRGGSWWEDASQARIARRVMDNPANRYDRLGFRCVWGK